MGERLAQAVARRADSRLLWCVDRDLEAARRFAGQFEGSQADDDVESLLFRSQVEAVLIATRPDSHAQLVAAAARAGKHVFVEAPLAIKLPDGTLVHHGDEVYGGGGYHTENLDTYIVSEGVARALSCVDNQYGEIAVFNSDSEIEITQP